jgi:hypothetical protein
VTFHPLKLCSAHNWSCQASSSTRPSRRHRLAVLPRRSADYHGGPIATADETQHSPSSDISAGGAPTSPLCPSPPGWCTAAAGSCLRQSTLSVRAVNTFLSPADRRKNGQCLHSPTQAGQDTSGHRAGTAAAQGTPHCAGTTMSTRHRRHGSHKGSRDR